MRPRFILVGLGNPGKTYEKTRHNFGFMALDVLATAYGTGEWEEKQKFTSHIMEATINDQPCLLVKPQTYMNRSGEAIQKIITFFKVDPVAQLLVLCDDIDVDFGAYRLRLSGGPGTHNGLKSLVDTLGENFPRIRFGLGRQPEGHDLAAWVLSKFSDEEMQKVDSLLKQLPSLILTVIKELEAELLKRKFGPKRKGSPSQASET